MLRLTGIRLHNICVYDDFHAYIQAGLTAVCGPNGFGKTSLLRGLAYALTGIVDGSWGSQATLQKDGTADPGWAEADFTSGSSSYRIRRFSTSGGKFPDILLDTTGDTVKQVAIRRQAVDAAMQGLLGIPVSLMFQICWGRQGQLDMMLTAPSAIINTFLQNVFDMRRLEKLRERIKAVADTVAVMPDVSAALAAHREKLGSLVAPPDDAEIQASEDRLQAEIDRLSAYRGMIQNGVPRARNESEKKAVAQSIRDGEKALSEINVPEEPYKPDMDMRSADAALAELGRRHGDNVRVIMECDSELQAVSNKRKMLQAMLEESEHKHAEILGRMEHKDDVCRLCRGRIVDTEAYERDRWMLVTGHRSMQEYMDVHNANMAGIRADIDAASGDARNLEEKKCRAAKADAAVQEDMKAVDSIRDAVRMHDEWLRGKAMADQVAYKLDTDRKLLGSLESAVVYDDNLDAAIAESEMTKILLNSEIMRMRDQRASYEADRRYLEQTIATEEEMQRGCEVNSEARKILSQLRDAFSQSGAQAVFLRSKIRELNRRIDEYMAYTSMPFTLRLNEDTHVFEYTTPEGYTHPSSHLSGAQKSMSSVVLQMALLTVIQPRMNLFLIDEPSEALDDSNKVVMAGLFDRMNRLLPSMEGVMLIVARDTQILAACENEIRIG